MQSTRAFTRLAVTAIAVTAAAYPSPVRAADRNPPSFLTGPNEGPPLDIALSYLRQHMGELGLAAASDPELVVTSQYASAHNGVTHIYLRQAIGGIPVLGTEVNVNVARDGAVMNVGGTLSPAAAATRRGASARIDAVRAVEAAARHLGLTLQRPPAVVEDRGGPDSAQVLTAPGASSDRVPARLVYKLLAAGGVRLAWDLDIDEPAGQHWWNVQVDAASAEVLATFDYVTHDDFGTPPGAAARGAKAGARPQPAARDDAPSVTATVDAYNVYAIPKESPYEGDRTLVTNPADATASPFRWHDTDGAEGPEFTVTRGNNVHAYTDIDANNVADPGSDPSGGPDLVFDFPLDLLLSPSTYRPATVTNLFYWNNIIHDVTYRYGFDEVSGNFQVNQYGHAGLGNDDVRAEAQDGSGTNNANFGTPVDGLRPRMQMFVWTFGQPNAVIVSAGPAAGNYPASGAAFGPQLSAIPPVSATAVVVNDGVAPESDGCEPFVGFPAGSIAILDRGLCTFVVKTANAQAAGAVAVIVANNAPGDPILMGGVDPTITIPSVMVNQAHGALLKANAPLAVTLGLNPDRPVDRDSDLDAGVIAHEYTHGISNRLTGGPAIVTCLNNAEQMGEGWSDISALVLTAKDGQTGAQPRGIGNYVSFRAPDGQGIRPAPYSTDMSVNPVTYGAIGGLIIPHGVGYAWASMLWEMYWNLVDKHGFNPDIYGDWTTGGNNLFYQLVLDGMKLQVCRPGFVDGRNAILLADQALTGGENQCAIWHGFAKRGLGFSASQGLSSSTTDGTEAFDLPALCQAGITVSPGSLASTQPVNRTTSQVVTLTNTSAADGTDLEWTITEAATDCSAPTDLPWVGASPGSGSTDPASSDSVVVTFDSNDVGVGTYTGKLCISSNAAATPVVEVALSLTVQYDFRGFFFPVDNPPAVNRVHPGLPILLRYKLGGYFGSDILAVGSPSWQQYDCTTGAPIGASEAGVNLLGPVFIPFIGEYVQVVGTRHGWHNTCRRLTLTLNDGTSHSALFKFR